MNTPKPHITVPTLIRIRFNTEHTKTPGQWWRILIGQDHEAQEFLASGFCIRGTCYSTHEILPLVGEKWHVGCIGTTTWEDNAVSIVSV